MEDKKTIKEHTASYLAGLAEKELLKWNNNTILTADEQKEFIGLFEKSLKYFFDNNKDAFSPAE